MEAVRASGWKRRRSEMLRWLRRKLQRHEELGERPSFPRVPPPRKRGRTREQQAIDKEQYAARLREQFSEVAAYDRKRAVKLGCERFVWRTSKDEATCPTCRQNEGKTFSYARPPTCGFPGEVNCCDLGWCRCVAAPVLPPRFLRTRR